MAEKQQNYHKNYKFYKISVIFSVLALTVFASNCSARTTQTFQPIQSPSQPLDTKSPARRIMHPAFQNAGKNPGLEIWRIENFNPVVYPARDFGKFYTGDSYIVLNSKTDKNNRYTYDVHFWLGSETSQDEAGSAAILTVQLDDILNGVPVQHREVQDHESSLFLGYFKNGIRYEKGGVASGFRHIQTNDGGEKRLFQVKGKRNVRVRQVNLSISSMNKGDCFILDAGNEIYVYVGSGAKRVEKLKAISAANQIRDQDHNGRAKVNIIDEFSTETDKEQFFSALGSGSADQVPDESVAEDDAAFETADERSVTLYKVSDQSGTLKVDTISTKPLKQEMLETADCFILDTGSGIYVWVGRGATAQEKSQSLAKAQDFLKSKKYPAWTQVHRIVEGAESAPFKQYFATWRDVGMQHTRLIRAAMGYDSDMDDSEIDHTILDILKKKGGRAIGFMPDHAHRTLRQIEQLVYYPDEQKVESAILPVEDVKMLLGFATYLLQYDYENKNGDTGTILYAWEGEKAANEAKVELLKYATKIAANIKNAMVVRVVQGHEPRHFLKIFKGKLITTITGAPIKPQLFRIRGSDKNDVSAHEVPATAEFLASDDAFALLSPEKLIVWIGKGASDFEKDMAQNRLAELWDTKELEIVNEGQEPEYFWELLHGKSEYDKTIGTDGAPILEPRLYHCNILPNGKVNIEEIEHYEQADLNTDDVMILDGGDELYTWVGSGTTDQENDDAFKMALEYFKKDESHRHIDTVPIIKLHQNSEPKCFKVLFPSWDDNYWKSLPTYEEIKKSIEDKNNELI